MRRPMSPERRMLPEYQPKQFLGVVTGLRARFNAYNCGRPGWVLLRVLSPDGHEGGLEFAYPRREFRRGVIPPAR